MYRRWFKIGAPAVIANEFLPPAERLRQQAQCQDLLPPHVTARFIDTMARNLCAYEASLISPTVTRLAYRYVDFLAENIF